MKKALTVGIALALIGVWSMSFSASADTVVTAQVGQAPTVTGCNPNTVNADGLTHSLVITGTLFIQDTTNATAVSFNGTGITVNSFVVDSDTQITANVTVAHSATTSAGPRSISVTVVGYTGTGDNLVTVNGFIEIGAPSGIDLGLMTKDVAKEVSSSAAGSVVSNYGTWTVTAKDANIGTGKGQMLRTSDSAPLTQKLLIGEATGPTNTADSGFSYGVKSTSLPFFAKQTVVAGDQPGNYTITITFTSTQS